MAEICAQLRAGNVSLAAARFTEAFGLSIQRPGPPHGEAVDQLSERMVALVDLLAGIRKRRPAWWAGVAAAWLELEMVPVARACTARARHLIETGARVSWPDLRKLATIDAGAAELARELPAAHAPPHTLLPVEPATQKQRRLRNLLGLGDSSEQKARIAKTSRETDVLGLALCARSGPGQRFMETWASTWFKAGEHQIVVETLLGLIHDQPLAQWLPRAGGSLVTCGMALRHLGDQVTAFACFRLVAWLHPEAGKPETGRGGALTPQQAAHGYVRDLAWAEAHLPWTTDGYRLSAEGPRIGRWLAKHQLGGRFLEHLDGDGGLKALFPRAVLARQLRWIGGSAGWFRRDTLDVTPAAGRPDPGYPPAPPELPSDPVAGWQRQPPAARDPEEKTPGRSRRRRPTGSANPPRRIVDHEPTGPTLRLQLGLTIAKGKSAPAVVQVAAGAGALLAVNGADDSLFVSLATQALDAGRQVVWLRRGSVLSSGHRQSLQGWLRIAPGESDARNAQWLRDLTASPPIRTAATALLEQLLPESRDPVASLCLAELLTRSAGDEIWSAFRNKDQEAFTHLAVQVASDKGQLDFRRPTELRRAAFLVGYLRHAVEALERAVCMGWFPSQTKPGDPATVRCPGIFFEVPPVPGPHQACLSALLALGSLAHSPQAIGTVSIAANLDDFDLEIRPRTATPPMAGGAKVADEPPPPPGPARPTQEAQPQHRNQWADAGFPPPGQKFRLCVLFSGDWGGEVQPLIEWFKPGGLLGDHELVAGFGTIKPEILRHDVLSHFKSFVISDLAPHSRQLLAAATGISLANASTDSRRAADEVVAVRLAQRRVTSQRLVVWP